jgi:hypothetical protein
MSLFFINAALLSAAVLAVVPVLIHLLNRRRPRDEMLPTMRFLAAGLAGSVRRFRLRHLLVLALRVAAVLLIVAALARPAYRGAFAFRKGAAPVNAIIVIDNSLSMAYETTGVSRFNEGRLLARDVLRSLAPGSRAGLVVTGLGPRGEALDREPTFDIDSFRDAVDSLDLSAFGGDCLASLASAFSMASSPSDQSRLEAGTEVYVITDLLAHSWRGPSPLSPPPGASTIVLDVGSDSNANYSLAETESARVASPAGAISVTTTVNGSDLGSRRLVEVFLDSAKRAEKLVELPARSAVSVGFEIPVSSAPSSRQGWVALVDSDPVLADNTRYFTVEPARPLRCLVLYGTPSSSPGAAFYVTNALEPPALKGASFASVTAVSIDGFTRANLDSTDVVVLVDAARITSAASETLAAFVASGGGLVVFPPENVSGPLWNPLLAATLGVSLDGASAVESAPAAISTLEFDHPMLSAFREGRNGNLALARFYRWRRFAATASASARSPVRVASGDPLVFTAQAGQGRAVLAAFSPDGRDTDLVLRASFVPLVNEMVAWSAGPRSLAARGGSRNFSVGDPVSFSVPVSDKDARVEITASGDTANVSLPVPAGASQSTFRAFFPGNYSARLPAESETRFSVNVSAAESLFERADVSRLAQAVPGVVIAKTLSDRPVRAVYSRTRGAREIFDLILVLAVLVLVAEAFLANRFYAKSIAREVGQ